MPFSGQKHKWFSIILMAGLPFLVLYRWMNGTLPYIENPNKKRTGPPPVSSLTQDE
jgi:hypothetical protein